jgi:putative nucleotidyltransferase with HDIG domain
MNLGLERLGERIVRPSEWAESPQAARFWALGLAATFVLLLTFILAMDTLIPGADRLANLRVGDVVATDVRAPRTVTFLSQALTERARLLAGDSVAPIYDPPDPIVARQQLDLGRAILDYITNVRLDVFGTRAQKLDDLQAITAVNLEPEVARALLEVSDTEWRNLDAEISAVLERVMREPIREDDLATLGDQLPMQVSVRFDEMPAQIVVAIVEDLIRPNQFVNPDATEAARRDAVQAVATETRSFEQGQVVVRGGTRLDEVDYESLSVMGLLETADTRWQMVTRALLTSTLVMVALALYIIRYQPDLRVQLPLVALYAALFLMVLLGAQVFIDDGQSYLYPAAALALLLVSLAQVPLAVISSLALALLMGLIANNSLEMTFLTAFGSLIGAASLRRTERLNTYFFAGLMVALSNLVVLMSFNLDAIAGGDAGRLGSLLIASLLNGLFAAAAALATMYLVTLLFNLPTYLKLIELGQSNQPLLQRLLREAPGTYQHSLQVSNLSEQAATAIGADAQLVRVAALYHDIGKMLNPAFFVENQAAGVNPHEQLNDPYRSADLIISHVVDGERLARQYRLPARVRDFILEHHGTTLVHYFHRKAMDRIEAAETVDEELFRYPGPRPRSRETAILMLADTCESTVRARKPTTRQEIADIVNEMVDGRFREGQLDESNLTSRDMKTIRSVFVEMLQAVFHPRINYPSLTTSPQPTVPSEAMPASLTAAVPQMAQPERGEVKAPVYYDLPDHLILPDVPPLRRVGRTQSNGDQGAGADQSAQRVEKEAPTDES